MPEPRRAGELVVASYNVHRCVGLDRRHRPRRVAKVLRELDADVIALQEVDSHPEIEAGLDQIDFLARETGLHAVRGPTLTRHTGTYGNALLSRWPLDSVVYHDLSWARREPRGSIEARLALGSRTLRLVATHLGLRPRERREQVRLLLTALGEDSQEVLVVLGDFNEWLPGSRVLRELRRRFGRSTSGATFPALLPLVAIDRIWVLPGRALCSHHVHRSPTARVASDHLPIVALIATA